MTVLTVVPTTDTLTWWLMLGSCALLFITLVSGLGEWLAHCRREQTHVVPRPSLDDLVRAFGDEQEQARLDWDRLEQVKRDEDPAR